MKAKFDRAKKFAGDHTTTLIYVSGFAAGVAVSTYIYAKYPRMLTPQIIAFTEDTPERISEIMKKSGGVKITNAKTRQVIQLVSIPAIEEIGI